MEMQQSINNMATDFAVMLEEMVKNPHKDYERDPYTLVGKEKSDQPWFAHKHYTTHKVCSTKSTQNNKSSITMIFL